MRQFVSALVLFATLAAGCAQGANVLASGNDFDTSNTTFNANLAHVSATFTFVPPSAFSSQSLAGYNAIWLDGFSQYLGLSSSNLINFMTAGGVVFVQNPGFGSDSLSAYPYGIELTDTYTSPTFQATVRVIDSGSPIDTNLTSANLSGWSPASAFGYFGAAIGSFTGLTDDGTTGQWVTLVRSVGNGLLVYTQQGISQSMKTGSLPASSGQLTFLSNVLTRAPTPVTLQSFAAE